MGTIGGWLCYDQQPHEPHTWTVEGDSQKGICPGVEELPEASCPEEEPHDDHDWRADPLEDLKHCPGVPEPGEEHELEFIYAGGASHPVAIYCRCGDRFDVRGPL